MKRFVMLRCLLIFSSLLFLAGCSLFLSPEERAFRENLRYVEHSRAQMQERRLRFMEEENRRMREMLEAPQEEREPEVLVY